MWLNAFFASPLMIRKNWGAGKVGRCQMTTLSENELQASRREAWEDTIFELAVLAVLIAMVWVILSL
jgi:hypothetical protein